MHESIYMKHPNSAEVKKKAIEVFYTSIAPTSDSDESLTPQMKN